MSKPRTRKIQASALREGMVVVIPAQKGFVKSCVNVDEIIPSMSKHILHIEMEGRAGPWRGASGKILYLDSDTVEIEIEPNRLQRFVLYLVSFIL